MPAISIAPRTIFKCDGCNTTVEIENHPADATPVNWGTIQLWRRRIGHDNIQKPPNTWMASFETEGETVKKILCPNCYRVEFHRLEKRDPPTLEELHKRRREGHKL